MRYFTALLTLTGDDSADVDLELVVMVEDVPVLCDGRLQLLLQQVSLCVVLGQQFDLQKVDLEVSFQVCKNLDL